MTRDEAIDIEKRKLAKFMTGASDRVAEANIDALIELGVLKVEEPKSVYDVLASLLKHESITVSGLISLLSDAGLKIVEK